MRDHRYFDHGGHPFFDWLLLILLLILVVAAVVWVVQRLLTPSSPPPSHAAPPPAAAPDPALQALRLRYARGEVSGEEFARISEDLGAHAPPPAREP